MHRIDTPTAQKDKFGQGKNGFTNGDPATGRRATDLNSDMWDAVQEEVCTVIEAAGIQLSKGEHTQLHAAIGRLIDEQVKTRLEKNQNGADIPNKPLFLQNVGLEETINLAADALQKSQNGGDIPDKKQFARTIGAVTSTTITLGESGWFKIATVVMPQATSTAVIKLYGG
ncbi:TPA: phage tail protein, partial [Salmonella enterica]